MFIFDHRAQVFGTINSTFLRTGNVRSPQLLRSSLATRGEAFLMLLSDVLKILLLLWGHYIFQWKFAIFVVVGVQGFQIFLLQLKSLQLNFAHFPLRLFDELFHVDPVVCEVEGWCCGLEPWLRLHNFNFLHHFDPFPLLHGLRRSFGPLRMFVPNIQLVSQRLHPFLM